MSVGITGAKVWPNEDTAKEFVEGLLKGIKKNTAIVTGGQKQGVDLWAETAARARSMRLTVLPPLRIKGKPYHTLNYNERNKKFIASSSVIFAIVPDSYDWTKGETKRVVEEARIAKRHHIIVKLKEDGIPSEVQEIKAEEMLRNDVAGNGRHDSGDMPKSTEGDVPVQEPRSIALKKDTARSSDGSQRGNDSDGSGSKVQVPRVRARKESGLERNASKRGRKVLVLSGGRKGKGRVPPRKPERLKVKVKESKA